MAKRWTKQKSSQQKAKHRRQSAGAGSAEGASGAMGGIRRGLRSFGGGKKGPKSNLEKLIDVALWLAVIAAGSFFVMRQCR